MWRLRNLGIALFEHALHVDQRALEILDGVRRREPGRERRRETLQLQADLTQVDRIAERRLDNLRAAIGTDLHQSLRLEAPQGLAQERPAHPEALAQIALDETVACSQGAIADGRPDGLLDLGSQRGGDAHEFGVECHLVILSYNHASIIHPKSAMSSPKNRQA